MQPCPVHPRTADERYAELAAAVDAYGRCRGTEEERIRARCQIWNVRNRHTLAAREEAASAGDKLTALQGFIDTEIDNALRDSRITLGPKTETEPTPVAAHDYSLWRIGDHLSAYNTGHSPQPELNATFIARGTYEAMDTLQKALREQSAEKASDERECRACYWATNKCVKHTAPQQPEAAEREREHCELALIRIGEALRQSLGDVTAEENDRVQDVIIGARESARAEFRTKYETLIERVSTVEEAMDAQAFIIAHSLLLAILADHRTPKKAG